MKRSDTTEEGEELELLFLEPGVMAAYTGVDRLLESNPEGCGYIGISGSDLFKLAGRQCDHAHRR